ncbi:MAG: cohesin domain-containing protein [Caldilineaceae bacterium]
MSPKGHFSQLFWRFGLSLFGLLIPAMLLYAALSSLTPALAMVAVPPSGNRLAAGNSHTCGVTASGGVKCWGYNAYGQLGDGTTTQHTTPVLVTGLSSGVQAVAAGDRHTCALTTGGGVKCWGNNEYGQLGDGATTISRTTPAAVVGLTSGVQAIAAGGSHTCALLTTGGVKCWGNNNFDQLGDGSTTNRTSPGDVSGLPSGVQAIAAGDRHTCALTASGGVKCWGNNASGQLGDGSTTDRATPVDVSGLASGVQAIAASGGHTCALTTGGGAKCWGVNYGGQLGDGSFLNRTTSVDVSGLASGVQAIVAGGGHTCALLATGGVKCWGWNPYSQLGDGSLTSRAIPGDVSGLTNGVQTIAAGGAHTCALLTSDGIKCWGNNYSGQLGDGSTTNRTTPGDVTGLTTLVRSVMAGDSHTCALTTSGGVKCWGHDGAGQLGDGSTANRASPGDVSGLTSGVTAITAGGAHTCALTTNGGVKCWGYNNSGQLGDDTIGNRTTPGDVSGLTSGVQAITAGEAHTCALTASGGVKCWGWNNYGQLGDGSTSWGSTTPVAVSGLTSGVQAVMAGWAHTCALTVSGGVKCWGYNNNGQLGDGSTTNRATPVDVSGLTSGVQAITAGGHTCALLKTGGVKCWGNNDAGQLGDSSFTSHTTPGAVSGLTSGVQAITAGWRHTCALTTSGGVKCWGWNDYGQLGDGSLNGRPIPGDVVGLTSGVQTITAGWRHTCALITSGVKCWGANESGQLGVNPGWLPVDVIGFVDATPTSTPTSTPTNTPVSPTNTPLPPTATATKPPTATATPTSGTPVAILVQVPTAITAAAGSQVTVPVLAPNGVSGAGILAYTFQLAFNPTVLQLVNASTANTLSTNWQVVTNTLAAGQIAVAVYTSGSPLSGSGPLLNLVFQVTTTPGLETDLSFTSFRFNEGMPLAQTRNGHLSVNLVSLSGVITYTTSALPVAGVVISATGASSLVTTTNAPGQYQLKPPTVGNYTVTPGKQGDQRNAVSVLDAAWVAQCAVGLRPASDCPLRSGDGSGDGQLTVYDAALIARYVVGLTTPPSRVGQWGFTPVSRSYPGLNNVLLNQNYTAYLLGDVTRNWGAPVAQAADSNSLQASLVAAPSQTADVVQTLHLANAGATAITAYQLTVTYDANVLAFGDAALANQADGWQLVMNREQLGVVQIAAYGLTPLNAADALLSLHFQALQPAATGASVSLTALQVNEGAPAVIVPAVNQHTLFLPLIEH